LDPVPEIVEDVSYEKGDIAEVRAKSFPAGKDFFDDAAFDDEEDWEDDDDDEFGGEPDCRPQ
jgi:DnaJ homolog subfamily A member 2